MGCWPGKMEVCLGTENVMATDGRRAIYVGMSLCAFAALLAGLLALGVYPIVGALLAIAAMATLLYAIAGLCGALYTEKSIGRDE